MRFVSLANAIGQFDKCDSSVWRIGLVSLSIQFVRQPSRSLRVDWLTNRNHQADEFDSSGRWIAFGRLANLIRQPEESYSSAGAGVHQEWIVGVQTLLATSAHPQSGPHLRSLQSSTNHFDNEGSPRSCSEFGKVFAISFTASRKLFVARGRLLEAKHIK